MAFAAAMAWWAGLSAAEAALYVVAPAVAALAVLPSLLLVTAVKCGMRSTRPTPGRAAVGPGLTIHQWSEMDSKLCYDEMFLQSIYKRHGIAYAPGMTVLDIGANIGIYAFYAAQQCAGRVDVHCFEPMPEMYKLLAANAAELNAGEHTTWAVGGDAAAAAAATAAGGVRVTPLQLGCYDKREDVEFSFRPFCPVASTIDTGDLGERVERATLELVSTFRHYRLHYLIPASVLRWAAAYVVHAMTVAGEERVRATVIPLSDYITEQKLERIHMLKVDVECAEEQVLAGIKEEHWPRIDQLLVEAEDFAVRDRIFALLRRHGFSVDSAAIREEILNGSGTQLSIVYAWREGGSIAPAAAAAAPPSTGPRKRKAPAV